MESPLSRPARSVRLLAAGGTISMSGEHAVPTLDAAALVRELPELAEVPSFEAETVLELPGAQIALPQALELARRARDAARAGTGVVITTGTDTLEELAVLCAFLHDGDAPIVLTGANRPAGNPGADGPANLLDAVALAGSEAAEGIGVVVAFGGEVHAATSVRKVDSTGPAAFASPTAGAIGRVVEHRVWLHSRPLRPRAIDPLRLEHRVGIVTASLGDDGALLRQAAEDADGLVVVGFGAGHLTPGMLRELCTAVESVPVLITCRPDRSSMLFSTYGFEGSERDLRATGAVCVPFLSAVAARVVLLACLGAGVGTDQLGILLAPWDAR